MTLISLIKNGNFPVSEFTTFVMRDSGKFFKLIMEKFKRRKNTRSCFHSNGKYNIRNVKDAINPIAGSS